MKRLLTSCFGLGHMPIAPGTWGSIPPVIIFFLLRKIEVDSVVTCTIFGFLAVLGSVICIKFSDEVISHTGRKDPGEIVIDEFAGQSVVLMFAAFVSGNIYILCAASFLLFRFFDITKIWPAWQLERLHGGTGILLDDIMAGIYGGLAVLLIFVPDWQTALRSPDGQTLNIISASILGLVQGLTEFLPVSSSGHLVLFEDLLPDIEPDSPQMLLFDLSIHVATVLAIFVYYHKSIAALFRNLFRSGKYGSNPLEIYEKSPSVRFLFLAAVTTLVTGAGYFLFKEPLESARKLEIAAFMWLITGTLLLITDLRKRTRLGLRDFGIFAAVIIGLAQTAAIIPGISRSGATICTAILLGLHRKWAIEYSFLIAIPAILAGAGLKFLEDFSLIGQNTLPVPTILSAMAMSFIAGLISLFILIKSSRKRKLKWFAFYCYGLAVFTIIFSFTR